MPTSWAFASSACSALLLAGCGAGPDLTPVSFHAESGLTRVPDRRTGGSAEPVPTFRADGGRLTFVLHLRNAGGKRATVLGPVRDESGDDQQFVPSDRDLRVTIEPGQIERLAVSGRTDCAGRMPGQVSGKNGQRLRLAGGDTADVELGALIEFVCPR